MAAHMQGTKTFHGRGLEFQHQFKEWWSEARKSEEPPSPVDFLINFGVEGSVIKLVLGPILESICPYPSLENDLHGSGTIDYSLYHLKDGLKGSWDHDLGFDLLEGALQEGLKPNGPTEQDLKSLVEIFPPDLKHYHLEPCLSRNFSADFLQFFVKQISGRGELGIRVDPQDEVSSHRRGLDKDCMLAIQEVLPNVNSLRLESQWTEEAFVNCLGMMFQRNTPPEWNLTIPSTFVDVTTDSDLNQWQDTLCENMMLTTEGKESMSFGVKKLSIHLSRPNKIASVQALKCIPQMQQLQDLDMHLHKFSLAIAAPYLTQALQKTSLKSLCIISDKNASSKMALLDVLEAVRGNTS